MASKWREQCAKSEEWPLYDSWWLGIHSKSHPDHAAFDVIEVSALGRGDYRRVIASVMVPKIDGLVCESHSIIGNLIKQNVEAAITERDEIIQMLEGALKWCNQHCSDHCMIEAKKALTKLKTWRDGK